ncbi:hypothetical protein HPB48_012222 [Haemaphysalis longicornis]|uniref:Uncharacterized protein n=1 Tax=Haemaphysalis longicornis TaxID=44386 RepID=A0A9J6FMG9_HAELO|nr:hypothetical protein HPB48_012222 [Haemaphysalis longicornis]
MQSLVSHLQASKAPLKTQDVDFALGGLSIFRFRFLFIDFIYPYMEDVFAFVAKAAVRIPLTQAILSPFQLEVTVAYRLPSRNKTPGLTLNTI